MSLFQQPDPSSSSSHHQEDAGVDELFESLDSPEAMTDKEAKAAAKQAKTAQPQQPRAPPRSFGSKAPTQPVDVTEGMSEEERREHMKLMMKLVKLGNHRRFGKLMKDYSFDFSSEKLRAKTMKQLKSLEADASMVIGSAYPGGMISRAAIQITSTAEAVASSNEKLKEKFDITGLTATLQQDEDFAIVLDHLEIEYASWSDISPELRLLFIVGGAMAKQNMVNQYAKGMNATFKAAAAAQTSSSSSNSSSSSSQVEPPVPAHLASNEIPSPPEPEPVASSSSSSSSS